MTNSLNLISLDEHITTNDLYSISCQDMSGIPIFIATDQRQSFLSMEHTHPPASTFLHGDRWSLQSILKRNWFNRISDSQHYES